MDRLHKRPIGYKKAHLPTDETIKSTNFAKVLLTIPVFNNRNRIDLNRDKRNVSVAIEVNLVLFVQ